jgi:signal transduction histidine kinase
LGQHRPSQLAAAFLQVESLLRAELINLNITLEIAVDPRIFVDVPLAVLTHVLANILSNSKEASNAGGTIRIESADAGEAVYCTVTDNGPGIPREILERVLKGVTPSMRQHQGWGLLLSSLMLKANGGAIEFTSTGPSGTCITLALPKFRGNPNLGQVPLEMVVNN